MEDELDRLPEHDCLLNFLFYLVTGKLNKSFVELIADTAFRTAQIN